VNYFSSTHHWELRHVFTAKHGLEITPEDVLVDFGCGRGRVLNWWLSLGLGNEIYGLELDEDLARQAAERLKGHPNVTVLAGDGLEHLPADTTVLWSFNPFEWGAGGEALMTRLENRLREYGRPDLRVVLFRSPLIRVFEADPYWHVVRYQGREGRTGPITPPLQDSGLLYSFGVASPAR
jgi:hypothetical protein